jgi:hypothetical protein
MKSLIILEGFVLIAADMANDRQFSNAFSMLLGQTPWAYAPEVLLVSSINFV